MRNLLLMLTLLSLAAACTKHGGGDSGGAPGAAITDAPIGEFKALSPDEMKAQGLTEQDFYSNYTGARIIDPRVRVGDTRKSRTSSLFKNGVTGEREVTTTVSSISDNFVQLGESFTATIGISANSSATETLNCNVEDENQDGSGGKTLNCKSTVAEPNTAPTQLEAFMSQAISCYPSSDQQTDDDVQYGFYTLNGQKMKAIKYVTNWKGEVTCTDKSDMGQGSARQIYIETYDIPQTDYPMASSTTLLFSYLETKVGDQIVTKEKQEVIR